MKTNSSLAAVTASVIIMLTVVGCTAESRETTTPTVTEAASQEMRDINATELVSELGAGWNLGNSMDATGGETSWGNPITTAEMINAVSDAGFNLLRIPSTWCFETADDGSYTINPEKLSRTREIIEYAYANNMYVILNTHHEDSWLIPDSEHIDAAKSQFAATWEQLSQYFGGYDEHLMFEGMNEPRVKGGTDEWSGGTAEGRRYINELNSLFVETVRASGGNNAKRVLLITSFAASVSENALDGLTLPNDENVIVSLHAYTPYSFTYANGEKWEKFKYDRSIEREINNMYALIDKYVLSKGVRVIITECGAVSKLLEDGTRNSDEVRKWAEYYFGKGKEYGIPCIWWDNGYYYSGNELFGIFCRSDCTWYIPDLVETIISSMKR